MLNSNEEENLLAKYMQAPMISNKEENLLTEEVNIDNNET